MKKTVVFDFDGVVHSYTSGWQGIEVIPDVPVPGIKRAIDEIREHYRVVIVSVRCATSGGRKAVQEWLDKYSIKVDEILMEKPPAVCYIDDRAICFDGDAGTLLKRIEEFKPWYEREEVKSNNEQIEDMAKDLYGMSIDTMIDCEYVAEVLINDKGYRKQSDGKWIDRDGKTWCSLCGASNKQYKPPFCPHCGAKMKVGDE